MPIKLIEEAGGKLISVTASGKLTQKDYEHFGPEVERLIKKFGKIDILLTLHDFHGWDGGALWADIKFDVKHFSDIRRLAFVGETKWEKWMAAFCVPFTSAQIKYFDQKQVEQARTWILGQEKVAPNPAAEIQAKHAVFGIYINRSAVEKAVEQLKDEGFKGDEISVLVPHQKIVRLMHNLEHKTIDEAASGAQLGGILGWCAGLALIAIPGFGAAIVGGPIAYLFLSVASLGGLAVTGGAMGGLIGLLLPNEKAKHFESRLQKGDILLSVHCTDPGRTAKAKDILTQTGAEDIYPRTI